MTITKQTSFLTAIRLGPQKAYRQPLECRDWGNLRARLSWPTEEADLDLLVREPDGREYACFLTGPVAPNGLFTCDAPGNGLLFEQYTWTPDPAPGTYCFAASYFAGPEVVIAGFELLDMMGNTIFMDEFPISPGQVVSLACGTQCRRPGVAERTVFDCALAQAPVIEDPQAYLQFVELFLRQIVEVLATLPEETADTVAEAFCSAISAAPFIDDPAEFAGFAIELLAGLTELLSPTQPPTPPPTEPPTPEPTILPTLPPTPPTVVPTIPPTEIPVVLPTDPPTTLG